MKTLKDVIAASPEPGNIHEFRDFAPLPDDADHVIQRAHRIEVFEKLLSHLTKSARARHTSYVRLVVTLDDPSNTGSVPRYKVIAHRSPNFAIYLSESMYNSIGCYITGIVSRDPGVEQINETVVHPFGASYLLVLNVLPGVAPNMPIPETPTVGNGGWGSGGGGGMWHGGRWSGGSFGV